MRCVPAATVALSLSLMGGGSVHGLASSTEEACSGGGEEPESVVVEVEAVPIVVQSTTADYFVLYVRHEVDAYSWVNLPVSVTLGQAGTTTLSENVAALPAERYRVEKYLVADPADVDGDCIDDITELGNRTAMSPVNRTQTVEIADGAVAIPDHATFEALSVPFTGQLYVSFVALDVEASEPRVYFLNAKRHTHFSFQRTVISSDGSSSLERGRMTYDPELVSSSGNKGVYHFELSRDYPFRVVARLYDLFAATMPVLDDNLALRMPNDTLIDYEQFQRDVELYAESRVQLLLDEHFESLPTFLALNRGWSYGFLRVMELDERPRPRDIVIYKALPNELPRVAGIVTTVPQTPLSHVNLRAIQDSSPNAFVDGFLDLGSVRALLNGWVYYRVTEDGWELLRATRAQVDAHFDSSRPARAQTPRRDLSVTGIKPLGEIGFADWDVFGVKAANVAVLGTLGFPEGTVPDGFAVPFSFYDEFMKEHGLYDVVDTMLADSDFQADFEIQDEMLDDLRDAIKDAETPAWIVEALTDMHAEFPEGTSLRYRSSTNNEDLPGFNGAGLYDSKTQKPKETEKDGISKSLKQVYASLWNSRAFAERDFYRIDHKAAAMGVLVHPNYSDELANGVAVSYDLFNNTTGLYYVNTQVGEDLVTNPEALSVPEELLLRPNGDHLILRLSNQAPAGQLLLSASQLGQLHRRLETIHERFATLYGVGAYERFAMEIEFKITSDNVLAIKQARPWVFGSSDGGVPPPNPGGGGPPPPSGGGGGAPPPEDDADHEDDGDDGDDDDGGSSGGGGPPPRAAITVNSDCEAKLCRPRTGVPVTFEDTSTGFVRFRRWEFGDRPRPTSQTVDYTWSEPGFYKVTLWVSDGQDESTVSRTFLVGASDPAGTCEADGETLCLQDSRYAVGVEWWTAEGLGGAGSVVHEGTNDSGLFRFFDRDNWEVLIKVLDGCALNGHVWVFGASTTDLGYSIRVTDTVTGAEKEYRNEPGLPAPAITDGTAFPEGCQP